MTATARRPCRVGESRGGAARDQGCSLGDPEKVDLVDADASGCAFLSLVSAGRASQPGEPHAGGGVRVLAARKFPNTSTEQLIVGGPWSGEGPSPAPWSPHRVSVPCEVVSGAAGSWHGRLLVLNSTGMAWWSRRPRLAHAAARRRGPRPNSCWGCGVLHHMQRTAVRLILDNAHTRDHGPGLAGSACSSRTHTCSRKHLEEPRFGHTIVRAADVELSSPARCLCPHAEAAAEEPLIFAGWEAMPPRWRSPRAPPRTTVSTGRTADTPGSASATRSRGR